MPGSSKSSVVLEADTETSPFPIEIDSETPFRILVLGDFTGRANRKLSAPLSGRRPIAVDLDNFDEVIADLKPTLHLPSGPLRFRELDDFHPDHLHRNAEFFQKLANLQYHSPTQPAAAPRSADLLDDILNLADDTPPPPVEEGGDLSAFIKKAMAPHLEARPDAGRKDWEARVQAAAGEQMRAILHHPDFQALEAAWRAVWMLVQGLGDDAKIYLLDATLDELLADPAALRNILISHREPWSLLVGNFVFSDSAADVRRLSTLGALARGAGAPFLAEAQPPAGDAGEEWQQLRRTPIARSLGLVLPRFLLRLPYGKKTTPIETFPFEEMQGSVHAEYLWGNPAFCCAYLIAQAGEPGPNRRLDGLPLHIVGSETKPCAEVLLSEKDAEYLMDLGFMPLASMKDQDAVLLVRFQSIAEPLAALAGRWSE